ncbi:MAG TPA: DUF3060 domain-containing protein [Stellaceae bacterium]|nr:DUF3060 domain-containing protein [Stellaceae bacterium]
MMRTTTIAAVLLAGMAGVALAADPAVNFAGSNERFAGDCRGLDASLAGSGNTVTIHGACRAFQIAGGDNRVLVDMAANGTIKVYGSGNQVSWTSSGEVDVTSVGQANMVTRAR